MWKHRVLWWGSHEECGRVFESCWTVIVDTCPTVRWTQRENPVHRAANGIECFHSRGQHLCKFIKTKESVCMRKEFNSLRTGLGHQHGRRFIVLGHQYGRRDVMWKHSIGVKANKLVLWTRYKFVQIPVCQGAFFKKKKRIKNSAIILDVR